MSVCLVTDSASQLPEAWVEALGITVLALHETVDEGEVAATSGLGPGELEDAYRDLLSEEDVTGVVSVHLASKLSRTWESATLAASSFGGRVRVVDSENVGMAFGGAVAQAAALAHAGASLADVAALAERIVKASSTFIAVDKMDSLRRGGRVGAAFALFGGALSTKPVLRVRAGNLALAAKTRTVTKALQKLRQLVRDELGGDSLVTVHYSGEPAPAEQLALEFRKETTFPERVLMVEIEPVLAWHVGDNAVAVSVCPLEDPDAQLPWVTPGESFGDSPEDLVVE
ncbi:DegV family protein [Dietzia sp.]|uniref:DegV family protein n=1 Tax=Dietzia sp. TaxID=1871616 RepID=UPI002FD9E96F